MKHRFAVIDRLSLGLAVLVVLGYVSPALAQVRTIQTPIATLSLSQKTGDLVGLDWKDPALEVIREPRLGENFRILLPLPGYEANYFDSKDQKVSRIQATPDGVVCVYDSLRNSRETVPVQVRYQIRAAGGQLLFSISVENPTKRKLAEVMYGIIGGQQGIADRLETKSLVPGYFIANLAPGLFSRFHGGTYGGGNLGIEHDAVSFAYPGQMSMGWMDIYNPKAGVGYYYADQDPDTRLTLLQVELRPFGSSATVRDSWPSVAEAEGKPIGLTTGWVDMPYLSQGTFRAGPVALEVHKGDWHSASHIYRAWFDKYFKVQRPASWLRKQMAWQSIIMSNAGGVVRYRFSDLPRLAADAKKYGITTFEILGWSVGGIDRGYPQYTPDPRLGTPAEFRSALARIRVMGVHPLLFTNIQVADTATPIFHNKLKQYAVDGLWAPDWRLFGWGEGTISARAGLTNSNMTLVSPAHPGFRNYLMKQYLQMVRDGADGFQMDKASLLDALDFNPTIPTSPDKSLVVGELNVYKELLQRARSIDPNFAIASESWFDRTYPYVGVSYMRLGTIDMPSDALRYTFPEWTATIFGESPGDFNPMNNGMRYGLVWDLAPRHYNVSVDAPLERPLARYVQQLIRIRKQYADLLFFGRFNDTMGATVKGGRYIRYSVFKNYKKNDSSRACVVVNFGDSPEQAEVSFDNESGQVSIAAPFRPDRTAELPVHLTIPPQRLVVIVKK